VIQIIPYTDDKKEFIKTLNYEWLRKYFRVEPNDVIQLSDPKGEIIDKGGHIFYAAYNNEIVGVACLLKITEDMYELGKMAVTEKSRGLNIGNSLMEHSIALAKQLHVKKLVLYSNRSLGPALHLYKKYGFIEVPLEPGHYERADIKMQKEIV